MAALSKAQSIFMKRLARGNGFLKIYDLHDMQIAKALQEKGRIVIKENVAQYPENEHADDN